MFRPSSSRILAVAGSFALCLAISGGYAAAEGYRLVPGDRLDVSFSGQGTTQQMTVDIDGQLRLSEVGGLSVAGLTLDQAEELVEASVSEAGLYIDPQISLTVVEYAPVVVAGDVASPGSYSYVPGMSISTALAISGGSRASGISRFEVDRARTDTEGQLRLLNLEIAANVVRLARLEAAAAGAETLTLSDDMRSLIPAPATIDVDRLMEAEAKLLENGRTREATLLSFWDREIKSIESQLVVFEQRAALQDEIVANVSESLEQAQQLQERGLQTVSRLNSAEQREFDARGRALELESARTAASQALSDAQRSRAQFLSRAEEDLLTAIQTARVALDDQQLRYKRAVEQLSLLTNGNVGSVLSDEITVANFKIMALNDRELPSPITPDTRILPGDTLIVTIGLTGESASN